MKDRVSIKRFLAFILCAAMLVMYMPGMPSALKWPYEWVIIGTWVILGVVLALANRLQRRKRL